MKEGGTHCRLLSLPDFRLPGSLTLLYRFFRASMRELTRPRRISGGRSTTTSFVFRNISRTRDSAFTNSPVSSFAPLYLACHRQLEVI